MAVKVTPIAREYTNAQALDAARAGLLVDGTSDPLVESSSGSDGSETTASRKDHVHPLHHADVHTVAKHTLDNAQFARWANFTK